MRASRPILLTVAGSLALALPLLVAAPWTARAALNQDDQEALVQDGQGGDDEFSAHGFNVFRIEQEDKLTVPLDQLEEVWEFLKTEFGPGSAFLAQDPLLSSYTSEEQFTDRYFDTPTLQLHDKQSGVRHRTRFNLTNPNDPKSGRSLVQIKVNDISTNALERGEFKFEVAPPGPPRSLEDGHPLIGLVKNDQRADLEQRLRDLGLDPYAMRPILTVDDTRRRVYILRDGKSFLSISYDHAKSSLLWAKAEFLEIEPELNEIAFTEADAATRKNMERIGGQIGRLITERFPEIHRDLTPKYNKAFNQFAEQIPMLRWLERADLANANGVTAAVLAPVGVAFAVLVLVSERRRARRRR